MNDACVICGCTEDAACVVEVLPEIVGCSWADENPLNNGPLCTQCVPAAREIAAKLGLLTMLGELAEDLAVLEQLGLIERVLTDDEDVRWAPTQLGTALHGAAEFGPVAGTEDGAAIRVRR